MRNWGYRIVICSCIESRIILRFSLTIWVIRRCRNQSGRAQQVSPVPEEPQLAVQLLLDRGYASSPALNCGWRHADISCHRTNRLSRGQAMTNVFDEFGRVARTGVDRISTFRITTTADAALVDADTTSVLEGPASAKDRVRAVWILPGRTQWIRTAFPFRDWSLFFPAHATPAKSHHRDGLKPSVVPRSKCLVNEYILKSIIKGNPRNRNRSAPRGPTTPQR